jgi:hypothetical protein
MNHHRAMIELPGKMRGKRRWETSESYQGL